MHLDGRTVFLNLRSSAVLFSLFAFFAPFCGYSGFVFAVLAGDIYGLVVEQRSLRGRTLFITGASRGIGLAIALRAARDGANIAVIAKTTEPHPKLPGTIYTAVGEIEAAGGKGLPIQCDIRSEEEVLAAVAKTVEHFGGIDACINNA